MFKRVIAVAAAVAAVLVALVPATAAAAAPTATVGLDNEPGCLNLLLVDCNQFVSATVVGPVLPGAFRVRPGYVFEPVLVDRVDVQRQPFTLTYHVKPEAVWSDGTPVTADDFLFTLDAIRDPANNTLRSGYEHVVDATRVDAKTFTLRFSSPNPDWRVLFRSVLPRHVLAGYDIDAVFRNEIAHPVTRVPIGSGPFLVAGWTRGEGLTLTRNPRWWGSVGPYLDRIEFDVVPSSSAQFDAIRTGALDVIFPQPQFGIADLRNAPGVLVESAPGTTMEHFDFNVASQSMPLLRERWFRQAIAYSIDRDAVARRSHDVLVPSHPALHNLTFSSLEAAYDPVFARYSHDPARVAALMAANGCDRGPDGIWVCGGLRASVKFATTSGNQQRELVQQDMVEQARAAGIELVPDNSPPGIFFGPVLGGRAYESIMYAWVRLAALPSMHQLYGCGGATNYMNYCSAELDALARAADAELDPAERARLVNAANAVLADDLPSLPLFMRIALLVHRETLRGPAINPGGFPTWNVEAWRGPDRTPPVTTATATPAANANGWHDGPVTVTFAATDDDTGVQEHRYTLTGAQSSGHWVAGGTSSVAVSAEGITRLEYFATDASGNVETAKSLTIRIDRTPPVVLGSRTPAANVHGWNNGDVTVRFEATDGLSGIAGAATAVSVVGGEGSGQGIERSFVDLAGNRASATVGGINIDRTPPTLSCAVTPSTLRPPSRKLIPVEASVGVADGLSGPIGFTLVSVSGGAAGDIAGFDVGSPDTTGSLRAALDRGRERRYELVYEGADRAGNTSRCTILVRVTR